MSNTDRITVTIKKKTHKELIKESEKIKRSKSDTVNLILEKELKIK